MLLLTAAEAAVGGSQAEGGAGAPGAVESPQRHDLRQSGQSTLVGFSIITLLTVDPFICALNNKNIDVYYAPLKYLLNGTTNGKYRS